MPFHDSFAVQGQTTSARLARQMLNAATNGGEGVVNITDLECLALDVPGTSVTLNPGSCIIAGKEQPGQGSYQGAIYELETLDIEPTGSGGGRSDLIVIRAEDPTVDGTPWNHDVANGVPVIYARIIEDVAPGTTTVPAGNSAIPIARIDIPASTGTITNDYITDLRRSVNPRSERVLRIQEGAPIVGGDWDEAGNIVAPSFERYPQHEWEITIPVWATQAQILANWDNVYLKPTGSIAGTSDARGKAFVGFQGGPEFLQTSPDVYNKNQFTATNGYRTSFSNKDQIFIPEGFRGLTLNLRMYVEGTPGSRGRLVADNWSSFSADIQFNEIPAPSATL